MNEIAHRHLFMGFLLCLLLAGCLSNPGQPEPDPFPILTRVWADPSETTITLRWKYGFSRDSSTTPGPVRTPLVEPERVEIYFGESLTGLSLYKTLGKADSLLQFTGLIPGKPYYFKVQLMANNPSHTISSNVMAVAGKFNPLKPMRLPSNIGTFTQNQLHYIAYLPDTTRLLLGYRGLGTYLHNLNTNRWTKLSEQAGYPAWSKTGVKVAIGISYFDTRTTPASIDLFDLIRGPDSLRRLKTIRLPHSTLASYIWSQDEKSIILNLPLPSPSPIQQLFVANDSLAILGSPTRDDKHSFVWLDENRLLIGGLTSLHNVQVYNPGNYHETGASLTRGPVSYNLSKGVYERLLDHPQLDGIAFPTSLGQAAKIAYITTVSGYASVWLYDLATRKAHPLTKRFSEGPISIHGLQWNEGLKILSLYYSDYSAAPVVKAFVLPL